MIPQKIEKKVFDSLIQDSIKEISLGFLEGTETNTLESIKQEFNQNTFQVSQNMIWKNGATSYSSQMEKFNTLKTLVEKNMEKMNVDQDELKKLIQKFKIHTTSINLNENQEAELNASLTELILEGLTWLSPRILEKKEVGYTAATN